MPGSPRLLPHWGDKRSFTRGQAEYRGVPTPDTSAAHVQRFAAEV
jgi:hypothetical protein